MNPPRVTIYEVGPRDGLQSEKKILPPSVIVEFIERLEETGLSSIEVGSFVSPEAIPQLANTKSVFLQLKRKPSIRYTVLVPNQKGWHDALAVGAKDVAVFTAASNSFLKANIGCTLETSLVRFSPLYESAPSHGVHIRAYISCAFGCPYEGFIPVEKVAKLAKRLYDMGSETISLADTTGIGQPGAVPELIKATVELGVPLSALALHFHDTLERLAIQKIEVGLATGIRIIDSAVGNLGGCPYAPGASGNVATEDVVLRLQALGFETGIDLKKLLAVRDWIKKQLQT
ncbi:MAG: hydroxymethylglutaryl-CoA lyase [Gammaproteobacteria bacterium]|nr:hydroxymethylglutaryl-CoA lyase [Gammaproteobacteria bacterium]